MSDLFTELTAPNGLQYTQPLGLFINNEFVPSKSGKKIASIDPATENEITSVYAGGEADVNAAVSAVSTPQSLARAALRSPAWKHMDPTDRGNLMLRLAALIEEKRRLFATIDTWDNGKPYSVTYAEDVPEAFNTIRYYAGWSDKVAGQTVATGAAKFAYTLRQPVGVVAQVIPWNYPLSMAAWKLGPALACGCAVVLKAAEQTPLSALVLAECVRAAGFPPGVVNVVNGRGADAGAALVAHPDVDKVAFTGSTATARSLKTVTLETGGKSPALVFADADLVQAARWTHVGIMANQGQVCSATSRIFVHELVYDAFVAEFTKTVRAVSVVGDPFDERTFQGPQVSKQQYERVLKYVEVGKREGATLVAGGEPLTQATPGGKGYFVAPTIFTDVTEQMAIYQEEVFGPFVVIGKFKTEDEALRLANNTSYGLGSAVFTKDLERATRVAREIESGTVWVNSSNDCDYRMPFGGVKQSGVGRELGEAGLEAYTQVKAVHINMGSRL
ncbi:aldehyde dehydrogenase domain-containing protein [Macrophomina phaseolina]|uniref:Aldehyde dehydrogenase domain-containing protein n=1 Tax=Macrophomina phaseolina TaxID=35725 RepID=A0ABQ8G4W0_9PEZI|nr:aldehyde dehydrogenase domain-containing protein [Macrophomina phaseolina]